MRGVLKSQRQSGNALLSSMRQHAFANTRRYGAYIVPFSIVLMFVGFAGLAFNRSIEKKPDVGQSMDIGPYQLVSRGYVQDSNDNYIAERSQIDEKLLFRNPLHVPTLVQISF